MSDWNTTIERGRKWIRTLTIRNDGTLVNLTGYTHSVKVGTTTPTVTLGGTAGTVQLELSSAQTTAMKRGVHRIVIDLESGGGVPLPRITGEAATQ